MHFEAGTRPPKNLEEILRILGASISQFFDRKIDYVITNLPKDRWPLQPSLSPGCSSKENVDPRSEKSPLLSTGTHPSSTVENPPLGVTRGRAMLLAVKKASKPSAASSATDQSVPGTRHTHDVLLRAQEFGSKVLTIGVVRKWIRALPEDVKMQLEIGESFFFDSDTTPEQGDPELDRLWLLRPLARPCIKIVDLKARTRPNYMENTNYMECLWRSFMGSPSAAASSVKTPALHDAPQTPTTPAGTCTTPQASVELPPSTNVFTSQRTTGPSKRDPGAKDSPGVSLIRSSYRGFSSCKRRKISTKRSRGALAEPSGYCECCSSHFNNLYAHVTGTYHMNYAENAENFRQLDQLLSELPSIKEVLAKARGAKVLNIAPPPDADAPASPSRQAQKTTLQPTQAAHESIDDAVMDFNALPPLPTPSIPQDREVRDISASQLFSESGERSDIGIMGNLPSSLIVSEAPPTLQSISINAPATYSSLLPPLPLSPSVAPVQHSEQTTIMPFLGGFADGGEFDFSDSVHYPPPNFPPLLSSPHALPQPAATLDLSFESTCRPLYLPRGPPNLHSVLHRSQAPILREPAPSLTSMGLPMTPPRIGTCTVQEIISSVVISSPPNDPSAASLPPPRRDTSPVLKKRFRKCTKCQCVHVPTEVPIQLRLQCGGASPDRTRDTQTRPLPPPCSHFLLPQRSRAQPSKRTRGIAQKTRPKPSFPCAVCGSNVTYKVWSVLCSTCGLWVHANCSKMNPVQIRKLPQSHSWICPTCHMMALFGSLATLDDFCPRLSPLTVIPAPFDPAEEGGGPAFSNEEPKCTLLSSSIVSSWNNIPSRGRPIDSKAVNQGNTCMSAQSPILLEADPVDLDALSNDQDFQPPMIKISSGDEGRVEDVVQRSPPLVDDTENLPLVVVDQEHDFPRSPVLLDESMSSIRIHDEPALVKPIIISPDNSEEAEEGVSEDTPGENQTTTAESVNRVASPLEQSIGGVQDGDRYLQPIILSNRSDSPTNRTRQRRKIKTRRRTTEPVGRGSGNVFSFGSYEDLEPNFETGPNSGATQRVSEQSLVDSGATAVSGLPSPLLRPVLSPEVTCLAAPRQQDHLPRRASLVARESINLSLQALYTPIKFGSDRLFCFNPDAESASQVASERSLDAYNSDGSSNLFRRIKEESQSDAEPVPSLASEAIPPSRASLVSGPSSKRGEKEKVAIEKAEETAITSARKKQEQKRNRLSPQTSDSDVPPQPRKRRRRLRIGVKSSCDSTHPQVV
ncbi:hypothetical protein EGR_03228 [Echinococcus granulosus]|uniref:Zinc finger DBF type n=1 Tax=Echinococcus granulosus TaxID=6210 RepID=W6UKB3_ECHGR|nr:hypothetical protein EGR_03228 [Echinococcus granulosus]EUB61955.1 hypothetical protein EGR_03228 [Echinococcus granulosus]